MSTERGPRVAASVRARLKNVADRRGGGNEFIRVLERYAIERLLYRLSRSDHRDRFVLKGATLFVAWGAEHYRPTRDVDLLGFGSTELAELERTMAAIVSTAVEDDGLSFPVEAITASRIKEGQRYEGVRLSLLAMLDRVRIPVQVDVGFGDAVDPVPGTFPTLLDMPAPALRLYPRETVVAEKFHAMVALGMINTRMKDFYDVWALARGFTFEGVALSQAVRTTFQRREAPLPQETPVALTPAFTRDLTKQQLWRAFLHKNDLPALDLEDDAAAIARTFLLPLALATGEPPRQWPPGGPWR